MSYSLDKVNDIALRWGLVMAEIKAAPREQLRFNVKDFEVFREIHDVNESSKDQITVFHKDEKLCEFFMRELR